ncbi:MAG: hypothetical protein WBM62_06730 [Crocosphaera sp.]
MTDATQLTLEEIHKYREQFKDYPEPLDALDLIAECDGDLEESANLLLIEEGITELKSGESEDGNTLDKIATNFRKIICEDVFIDDLIGGLVPVAVTSLAMSGQIPIAIATPGVIYVAKKGIKTWCNSH